MADLPELQNYGSYLKKCLKAITSLCHYVEYMNILLTNSGEFWLPTCHVCGLEKHMQNDVLNKGQVKIKSTLNTLKLVAILNRH